MGVLPLADDPTDAPTPCMTQADAARRAARHLILRYGWNSTVFQMFNPGFTLWFLDEPAAVVGYVESSGVRVVGGAPVCAPQAMPAVVDVFEADARRAGRRVCYFCAQEWLNHLLTKRNTHSSMLLGAQPVWNPQHWPTIVRGKASLRAQLARARNKGVAVCRWSAAQATGHAALRRCLAEWLATRGLPPMHFLVEPDTLECLDDRRVYVAERSGQVVGFLVASPVPLRAGWLIEQIIRGSAAPNGTSELLLDAAMRDVALSGARYVSGGLSPLSRRAGLPLPHRPAWLRLLFAWVRAHGQRFYNFDGLDAFKARLLPEAWEAAYAISNEPAVSWHTLYAVAGAFSGMPPLWFVGRGVLRALRQEAAWLLQRARRG